MSPVCPATGHVILHLRGPNCPDHGVRWFADCPSCGAMWPLVQPMDDFAASELFALEPERAHDFCAGCATPGPWLSRTQLMEWVQNILKASSDISGTERHELLAVLDRLKVLGPNDTNTATAWKQVRDRAPKVWEMMKPARDALIGEAVKKLLGL